MSRVSENSSYNAINYSMGRTKSKLENLQIKGSNLKRLQKPSDDPIANTEILALRSKKIDGKQYLRNLTYARTQMQFTENAIEDLTELVMRAKEIGIGQASNTFGEDVRNSVAREVEQMRKQAIAIGNRRFGNKYIFAGHKTLTKPFDDDGSYKGDNNQTKLEIGKDVFVPTNFSGEIVFYEANTKSKLPKIEINDSPVKDYEVGTPDPENDPMLKDIEFNRTPASIQEVELEMEQAQQEVELGPARKSLFENLETLYNAISTDNHQIVQDLLPDLDEDLNRLIQVRTKIGSIANTIDNTEIAIEKDKVLNAEYGSKLEDADVAELFSDLSRQQNILTASYKASSQLMNNTLLDFIR